MDERIQDEVLRRAGERLDAARDSSAKDLAGASRAAARPSAITRPFSLPMLQAAERPTLR